jgi:hypothetical protein
MALPAMPGAPSPTPTPRPVSPGVSAGDYLTMELGRLQALNQNQNVPMKDIVTWATAQRDAVVGAEL